MHCQRQLFHKNHGIYKIHPELLKHLNMNFLKIWTSATCDNLEEDEFQITLDKICENTGFHWPVFPHIRVES